jgi:PEGA domain
LAEEFAAKMECNPCTIIFVDTPRFEPLSAAPIKPQIVFSRLVVPSLTLLLAGCASIVHGGRQDVRIQSTPGGAHVAIHNLNKERRVVFNGSTPCTASLNRGAGFFKGASYQVVVTKPGFEPFQTTLGNHVSGWYFGNFGFGGVLGFLIVDPATGGMFSLEPRKISADLRSRHARFFPKDGELRVALRSDVPKELVTHLKPIPRKS